MQLRVVRRQPHSQRPALGRRHRGSDIQEYEYQDVTSEVRISRSTRIRELKFINSKLKEKYPRYVRFPFSAVGTRGGVAWSCSTKSLAYLLCQDATAALQRKLGSVLNVRAKQLAHDTGKAEFVSSAAR